VKEVINNDTGEKAWVVESEEDLKAIHKECLTDYNQEDDDALTGVFDYKPDDVVLLYFGNRFRGDNLNRYPLFTNMKQEEFGKTYK